jgi:hypothetical protein
MIISVNGAGLGNRIKSIVSCMRLDKDTRVHWKKAPGILNCNFSDLFENNIEIQPPYPFGATTYHSWRLAVLPDDKILENFARITSGNNLIGRPFSHTDPHGRNIDLEYGRIPLSIREKYISVFKELIINSKIKKWVDECAAQFDEETVSVHIRSWEDQLPDEQSILRQKHFFTIRKYISRMDALSKKTRFFVSSDSTKVVDSLKSKYGERIIVYKRHAPLETSRSTRIGAQDDLAEMLLLSRNSILLGTYMSTFTEVAWWLGGAQAQVTIV